MVTADFGPEIELALFLRMRAEEIAKSLGKCMSIEELFSYYRQSRSPERMAVPGFDRKLLNSRFRACAVKIVL